MIMIHGGHGHLVGSFFSPATNRRSDSYGGDLRKRARFAIEVLEAYLRANPGDPRLVRVLEIVDREAAQAAEQIAVSSQQQLAGMEQVALAMENIKQATHQNVLGTKQAEQAAHTLNELGQKLKETVSRFKV